MRRSWTPLARINSTFTIRLTARWSVSGLKVGLALGAGSGRTGRLRTKRIATRTTTKWPLRLLPPPPEGREERQDRLP